MVITKKSGMVAASVALATGSAFLIGVSQSAGASAPDQAAHKSRLVTTRVGNDVFGVPVEIAPGNNGLAVAVCPRGTVLTGGGGATSGFNIFFTDSFRSGPRKWTVRGTNNPPTAGGTETLTAFARCL